MIATLKYRSLVESSVANNFNRNEHVKLVLKSLSDYILYKIPFHKNTYSNLLPDAQSFVQIKILCQLFVPQFLGLFLNS